MGRLRRRLRALVQRPTIVPLSTTVYLAEEQDGRLLDRLALPVFGEDVRYTAATSDSAVDALNDVGERFDIGWTQ